MPAGMLQEIQLFFICTFWGMLTIVYYDFFRLLRSVFYHNVVMVALEDFIYCFGVGVMLLAVTYVYNHGALRGYIFLGIALGAAFYNWGISPYLRGGLLFFVKKVKELLKNVKKQCKINFKNHAKEGKHGKKRSN